MSNSIAKGFDKVKDVEHRFRAWLRTKHWVAAGVACDIRKESGVASPKDIPWSIAMSEHGNGIQACPAGNSQAEA